MIDKNQFREHILLLFKEGEQYAKLVRSNYQLDRYTYSTFSARKLEFFDFGNKQIKEYDKRIGYVIKISYDILMRIIIDYFGIKCVENVYAKIGDYFSDEEIEQYKLLKNVEFIIVDIKKEKALLFTNVNYDPLFIGPAKDLVNDKLKTKSYQFVTCTFSENVDFIINKNGNSGENKIFISFNEFLKMYFEEDDYIYLLNELKTYISNIKSILGYSIIKNISYNSSVFFNKKIEKTIISQNYINVDNFNYVDENGEKEFSLCDYDYELMKNRFFDKKIYLLLLRNDYFAESLRTAEWLYDSIENIELIDLSTIALGYFKTIEQLLSSIVYVKKNKEFDIEKIKNDRITLGGLAYKLLEKSDRWFDRKYNLSSIEYIIYRILDYTKKTRNGYAHKHNINDKNEITKIRSETLNLLFLVLSVINLNNDEIKMLGGTSLDYYDDFYKLCEFINFNSSLPIIYFIRTIKNDNVTCIAQRDCDITSSTDHFIFSGCSFKIYESTIDWKEHIGKMVKFTRENIAGIVEINYVKIDFMNSIDIQFEISDLHQLYINGKYLGPESYIYDVDY